MNHYKKYQMRESLHHPAKSWRVTAIGMGLFGEIHLKSDIYRHKIYMIKEQFPLPLCTVKQRDIACHHI